MEAGTDLYKIFENSAFNHKYFLKTFKGAGGFGAVFLADQLDGDTKIQEVAIKAIRKDKMSSENIKKELGTAIRLKDPNLIDCITSEEGRLKHLMFDYDCYGLVMEIASGTLEQHIRTSNPLQTKVLGVSEVTAIVRSIASGLAFLHSQSITHRDLKPANVLQVKNSWKICDFGIARQMGNESGTLSTSLAGTPIYMPPEVYAAQNAQSAVKVAPAWDMWSLGVMIVQMLTGELPFQGLADILQVKISIKRKLPAPFDLIVQQCLLEDPKARWSAKEALEALNQLSVNVPPNPNIIIPQDLTVISSIPTPQYRLTNTTPVRSDVIVIGDRAVGKTSMLWALCDLPPNRYGEKYVEISKDDCDRIKDAWVDPTSGNIKPTEKPFELKSIEMYLRLPRPREIQVQLTDTRGEFWSDPVIQANDPSVYQDYKKTIANARYIVLVLHPHKDLVKREYLSIYDPQGEIYKGNGLYTSSVWANKLKGTLDFFSQHCKSAKHFFICMHKADLFCNFNDESLRWHYKPSGGNDFDSYISGVRKRYFGIAKDLILEFNKRNGSVSKLSFFITTNQDRNLLEIPWLCLGTYLVQDAED
jgi:serine/threonine protein kinase